MDSPSPLPLTPDTFSQVVEIPGEFVPYDGDDAHFFTSVAETKEIIETHIATKSEKKYGRDKAKVCPGAAYIGKIREFHNKPASEGSNFQEMDSWKKNYACLDGRVYRLKECFKKTPGSDNTEDWKSELRNLQYIVPMEHYHRFIVAIHKATGHQGRDKMKDLMDKYQFDGPVKDILKEFKRRCPTCNGKPNAARQYDPRPKVKRAKSPQAEKKPTSKRKALEPLFGNRRVPKRRKKNSSKVSAAQATDAQSFEVPVVRRTSLSTSPTRRMTWPSAYERAFPVDSSRAPRASTARAISYQTSRQQIDPSPFAPVLPQNPTTLQFKRGSGELGFVHGSYQENCMPNVDLCLPAALLQTGRAHRDTTHPHATIAQEATFSSADSVPSLTSSSQEISFTDSKYSSWSSDHHLQHQPEEPGTTNAQAFSAVSANGTMIHGTNAQLPVGTNGFSLTNHDFDDSSLFNPFPHVVEQESTSYPFREATENIPLPQDFGLTQRGSMSGLHGSIAEGIPMTVQCLAPQRLREGTGNTLPLECIEPNQLGDTNSFHSNTGHDATMANIPLLRKDVESPNAEGRNSIQGRVEENNPATEEEPTTHFFDDEMEITSLPEYILSTDIG